MFARILLRSAVVRPGRSLTTLSAIVVAATIATVMITLYSDVQAKLHREFRSYGANIVIVAPRGSAFPANALAEVDRVVGANGIAAPFAYASARTSDGTPIVVAGTDMGRARTSNTWWGVTAWPELSGDAMV